MAKKGKKRRPGGGRPQAGKRVTPKAAAGTVKPPTAGGGGAARSAKAPPTKSQSTKAQPTKAQPTKAQPTKAQRIEAARTARRRKSLAARLAVAAIAGILLAVLVIRVLSGRDDGNATRAQLTAGSCEYDSKADRTDPAPRNHVASPTYRVDPPAGGNHLPQAARPADYSEGQVPSDGQIVHALEHGYVVLWERPDLAESDRQALQGVAGRYQKDVLVVPRPSLPTTVAATAWGKRLLCGNVEPDALDLFVRTYRNKGPEKIPH